MSAYERGRTTVDQLHTGMSMSAMKRDIVVIGASAGGVEAVQVLVRNLPWNLPAAVFVVLHVGASSVLPRILDSSGPLPAAHAQNGETFEHGRIYVAPPDYHLLLEQDRTFLWRGPKENRFRPAVNTLFRSAAVSYRERVTGVVLSGALDDGSAGLWWIERHGGAALVQDPAEAIVPSMPESALAYVESAYIARAEKLAPLISRLAMGTAVVGWQEKAG